MMTSSTFVERIDLGTWYDCTQTVPLGIYSYPTLRNYSHDMFSSLTMVKSYKAQVYQYSPNVSKFPKYSWLYTIVKLTCDCENIFAEKQKSKKEITQHITIQQCHQLIHSFTATSTDGTLLVRLLSVSETFWKSYIDLSYSCTFGLATTNTQHQVTIHKPMEQIIGDSPTIEQHLTRTQCFSLINYSTRHGMSIPVEYKNKILIWADTNHHKIEVHSLGIYKIKQQGDYIFIQDLQAEGAVQEEFRDKRYLLQLDNVLELKDLKAQPDLVTSKLSSGITQRKFLMVPLHICWKYI